MDFHSRIGRSWGALDAASLIQRVRQHEASFVVPPPPASKAASSFVWSMMKRLSDLVEDSTNILKAAAGIAGFHYTGEHLTLYLAMKGVPTDVYLHPYRIDSYADLDKFLDKFLLVACHDAAFRNDVDLRPGTRHMFSKIPVLSRRWRSPALENDLAFALATAHIGASFGTPPAIIS